MLKMDFLHTSGIDLIKTLQSTFQVHSELMLFLSHIGDPRNAFLFYFPLSFCLHRPTGALVLWLACISEAFNGLFKWILHGERPYWWIKETEVYKGQTTPDIQQYRLTCETGPGSPSGHAMVTASVLLAIVWAVTRGSRLKSYMKVLCWSIYCVVMVSICISRCYIATHFPHQVFMGTVAGIGLTIIFEKISTDNLTLVHYTLVSFSLPVTLILTYAAIKSMGVDPLWSVTKATKWCLKSEWVHLDTTVFNATMRDGGAMLGYGIYSSMSRHLGALKQEAGGNVTKIIHMLVTMVICQILENLKPPQTSPTIYYLLTYFKFCFLVVMVTVVTMFPWKQQQDEKEKGS